jgi:hypothetical protein
MIGTLSLQLLDIDWAGATHGRSRVPHCNRGAADQPGVGRHFWSAGAVLSRYAVIAAPLAYLGSINLLLAALN